MNMDLVLGAILGTFLMLFKYYTSFSNGVPPNTNSVPLFTTVLCIALGGHGASPQYIHVMPSSVTQISLEGVGL